MKATEEREYMGYSLFPHVVNIPSFHKLITDRAVVIVIGFLASRANRPYSPAKQSVHINTGEVRAVAYGRRVQQSDFDREKHSKPILCPFYSDIYGRR